MIETTGSLDAVKVEGDTLTLEGWSATRGAGRIDDFRVSLRGRDLPLVSGDRDRPSPDVKAAHPSLDHADACRFRLKYRLDPAQVAEAETGVIAVTPLVQGRRGKVHIHLAKTSLPEPSVEDINMIGVGFLDVSKEFLTHFIQLADLKSDADVLDVGCGVGRMAYMLAHYLKPEARYEGFDIIDQLVNWASAKITPSYPNFHFQKADVYNKHYNPQGAFKAEEFRFPYEDESFDFIFLTSVFTHMFGKDVRHYLDEFRRVLRPGGRCLTTCFLLNDESRPLIRAKRSTFELVHPVGDGYTSNPADPEDAIGFDEGDLLGWLAERGFEVEGKHYGAWCGRPNFLSFQDVLVYRKGDLPAQRPTPPSKFRKALRDLFGS
ncbi:class I SAM-dependent methyltransferase [Paludisphaera soli]|uniref:class I SAM-dependent methyltransferase n=1 Tax=Paludisphaera soli TaxID=2712865 RepID=UPI0013EAB491|nr:class I SAM-dependent methyltransferase [Paludisphaera soli]